MYIMYVYYVCMYIYIYTVAYYVRFSPDAPAYCKDHTCFSLGTGRDVATLPSPRHPFGSGLSAARVPPSGKIWRSTQWPFESKTKPFLPILRC
jgi:hypothetical protein